MSVPQLSSRVLLIPSKAGAKATGEAVRPHTGWELWAEKPPSSLVKSIWGVNLFLGDNLAQKYGIDFCKYCRYQNYGLRIGRLE